MSFSPINTKPEKTPRQKWRTFGIASALTVAVIAALYGVSLLSFPSTESKPSYSEAHVACERAVKNMLVAPATAKFSNRTEVDMGDNTVIVSGYVDAQNSFGANVRSHYSCDARMTGDWPTISNVIVD